eukprot:gene6631-6859_t
MPSWNVLAPVRLDQQLQDVICISDDTDAVKIGDLNDFIAPSQACVVSLQAQKAPKSSGGEKQPPKEGLQLNTRSSKRKPVKQQSDDTKPLGSPQPSADINKKKGFQQTVIDEETNAVKVSLNDCLACSGCVTSAETVLLQHQSLQEFVARCADPDAIVVVSISPQSRASLAALHGVTPEDVQWKLANFLKHQLSVALVLDIGLGSTLALTEAAAEFVARYRQNHRHTHGTGASFNTAAVPNGSSSAGSDGSRVVAAASAGPLPMLASACPGWVCYAEKTHGRYILPHISTTRSPQGIMGALVKQVMAAQKGWPVERIYHVTVMPCYDKKLEASRDDFLVPDLQELQLLGPDGQPLLRFAIAYGFRNIQTLVRKIKSGQCEYHYVEVMACPSGCLNGGGQLKPQASGGQKPADLQPPGNQEPAAQSCATDVNDGSSSWLSWAVPCCASTAAVAGVYRELLDVSGSGDPGADGVRGLLHTQYHHREKTVSSTISDW